MKRKSSKDSWIYKGELENAGLSEVAYYIRKAKHFLDFASFALSNSENEFSNTVFGESYSSIEGVQDSILKVRNDINLAQERILASSKDTDLKKEERAEKAEREKSHVQKNRHTGRDGSGPLRREAGR